MRTLRTVGAVLLLLRAAGAVGPSGVLEDPGFEAGDPARAWTPHVYGAKPLLSADRGTRREGRQSLRIASREPSDTALAREIALPPGRLYRLSAWVKTKDLRRAGRGGIGATLQIQCPDAPASSSRSLLGTNDWTREEVLFRVPSGGRVRVVLFFFGFGKGTGTVWFDGVALEEVTAPGSDRLKVTRERLSESPVSPFQVGQFVEILCDLIPSMHAERIDHGSFEVFPPFRVAFRRQIDRRDRPWYPSGAVHRGGYAYDEEDPFNGKRSLRIRVAGGEPCTLGISQGGIFLEEGKRYRLRLHMRAEGEGIAPRARLHGGGRQLARAPLGRARPRWTRHGAVLTPVETCLSATLTIEFRAPGTLWLDRVSLLPEDAAPGGWRRDVVEALRRLRPGMIRFGGSAIHTYEWEACVGDVDRRVPFTTSWGGLEPNEAGLEAFITLCRLVEAEPLICVRWKGKRPEDAAAEVEYFNGPSDSRYGRLRARNGHPDPYGVTYWQIGNEVGGPEYVRSVRAFAAAMKRVDPAIRILSSFPDEGVLREAGDLLDYLCPHHYGCADLKGKEDDLRRLAGMIARLGGGRPIRVAVTEWNTTAGDWGLGRGSLSSLGNALKCSRYHNLIQRHAALVEIAVRSNLADSFGSGIIQTNSHGLYRTPTYWAQEVYARAAGFFPLRIETALPFHLEELDASALASPDGERLLLYVVNDARSDLQRRIDLRAFSPIRREVEVIVLRDRDGAGERDVMNGFDDPDRVAPAREVIRIPGPAFDHTFPALSLTRMAFARGG